MMIGIAIGILLAQSSIFADKFFNSLTIENGNYDVCITSDTIDPRDACFTFLTNYSQNFYEDKIPVNLNKWEDIGWKVVIETNQ